MVKKIMVCNRLLLIWTAVCVSALSVWSQTDTCAIPSATSPATSEIRKYQPSLRGVFRGRWEMLTENGDSHFEVRNARLALVGDVGPIFHYFIQADLCDRGTMKILDAFATVNAFTGFDVRMGQYVLPFGEDAIRAPATYLFANRSYVGKDMSGMRAVGIEGIYQIPQTPMQITAGIFNGASAASHNVWQKKYTYAGRIVVTPGPWRFNVGLMSQVLDEVRMNLAGAAVQWRYGSLLLDGEYMYKHYTNHTHADTHGYVAYADYYIPLRGRVINRMSWQVRLDGITDHSGGKRDTEGKLTTDRSKHNRLTAGTTISHIGAARLHADIRLNYEKMFFPDNVSYKPADGDRLVLEMVVAF